MNPNRKEEGNHQATHSNYRDLLSMCYMSLYLWELSCKGKEVSTSSRVRILEDVWDCNGNDYFRQSEIRSGASSTQWEVIFWELNGKIGSSLLHWGRHIPLPTVCFLYVIDNKHIEKNVPWKQLICAKRQGMSLTELPLWHRAGAE